MSQPQVDAFVAKWQGASGSERANYQLFLTELCEALELPRPEPATRETEDNAYVFERKVTFGKADGGEAYGWIDLYRRGSFVLEAKQTGKEMETKGYGSAMTRAHGQAQSYARALPAKEGRPPFLLVVDVGRSIELFSEFTRSGSTYVPFPDPRSHRLPLEALQREEVRHRLRAVWLEPMALDPSRISTQVTKAIAADLAKLAEGLEKADNGPDTVAAFLMRCLFTMFAEDVGLLPARCFTELLEEARKRPTLFPRLMPGLWRAMNDGGFSAEIRTDVLRFNGGLFSDQRALTLDRDQIDLLLEAARADWKHVEPAIFGTLLERALDPEDRHRLGAHYTPRAYVERLVMPTVIEPLREEWTAAQAAALTLERQGRAKEAIQELRDFHDRLCHVRVLDPACGSGNFLYVTLEHLKRLEGEVFNALEELGHTQGRLEMAGATVDPHQMLGLETNPRAARIAEAVLWIGYLQWHFRTRGNVNPPEPVLRDFHNIENRDAVLAWDKVELVTDEAGRPVSRWDGETTKAHPVTGEQVPDEEARVPLERYVNPRKAEWPEADFVVGNPPFIGSKRMRAVLGQGYLEALRSIYPEVAASTDYVMYWWHRAAVLVRRKKTRRFGLITTNSLTQTFNKRVVEGHLRAHEPVSLVFAIPDHPWVDSSDGAAVRIAMSVAALGSRKGTLALYVDSAGTSNGDSQSQSLRTSKGTISSSLQLGTDLAGSNSLTANRDLCWQGCKLVGKNFQVTPTRRDTFLTKQPETKEVIKRYWSGRDLTRVPSEGYVVDTFGLTLSSLVEKFPVLYQYLRNYVYPDRAQNRDKAFREKWWLFGRSRPELRAANEGLTRYIATCEVAKHRAFSFLRWPGDLIDGGLIAISTPESTILGVLSSRIHVAWALTAGGRMGLGNHSRYFITVCFDPFPFPVLSAEQEEKIRHLGEKLDSHRKRQQALHPKLTMTGMYNVLEKLRIGDALSTKEKAIHEQGLVSVLAQIHDELDAAVLDAYGWSDLAPALVGKPGGTTPSKAKSPEQEEAEEELLTRLVALNAERAAEESQGLVRWLRPDFQNPGGTGAKQDSLLPEGAAAPAPTSATRQPWPKTLAQQVQAVRDALAQQPAPADSTTLARTFKRAKAKKVEEILETLTALGQARSTAEGRYLAS